MQVMANVRKIKDARRADYERRISLINSNKNN